MNHLIYTEMSSPLGTLLLVSHGDVLYALDYAGYDSRMRTLLQSRFGDVKLISSDATNQFKKILTAYFEGDLHATDGIKVDGKGTTFERRVWQMLRSVPPGTTASYGEIARRLGLPITAARAVGIANSRNPIAIVVPCHRIIGANGKLTGYAGGLHRKQWLLEHEGALDAASMPAQEAFQFCAS